MRYHARNLSRDDSSSRAATHAGGTMEVLVCKANIAAIVFLPRLVVPLNEQNIPLLLPIAVCSIGLLLIVGKAVISQLRLLTCLAFLVAATTSQALGGTDFSISSL